VSLEALNNLAPGNAPRRHLINEISTKKTAF